MERIKGFTIELELDNMKVDSGLTDLKTSMRQMNSEMRSNMSQFDFGEKSLKKYGAQLDGLNKKYELQQMVVDDTRKRYEALRKEKGENHSETQKAAAAYNHELAQLNNLERHIGKVTDKMKVFKREQEIQSTSIWKTGDALENFGSKLGGVSQKARDVGGTLTRRITLPVLGVTTAIGGMVAAFGWGRLKSVDNAQAQLKGLGYETEDVERISGQLSDALEGGMLTMGEATSAAATAMASGVKEGEELTRYIQILDGTVAGSSGTFEEMEQIFGRIVDQGSMTRNEFDMIAQRMPGFSTAVQDNMNISSDEMYEMLRNGEITTNQFLDIMEDFSGDMATEYAKTWDGMKKNTKAFIGIIGENLLGGVFEKSKESLAEFIKILSSNQAQTWAKETGETLGNAFSGFVDKIKDVIYWFKDLSDSQKKFILSASGFVVALGPLLLGLGTLGGIISRVSSGLGVFFKWLAPIMTPLKGIGTAASGAGKSVGLLSRAFTLFTGPVGIAIGIISLLVTAFTTAYKRSETFRDFIHDLGEKIKEVFFGIVDWIKPGFDAVINFFGEIKEKITAFRDEEGPGIIEAFQNIWDFVGPILEWIAEKVKWAFDVVIKPVIGMVMSVVEGIIKMVWGNIKGIITGTLDVIMGAIKIFSGVFTGDTEKMWEGVKQLFFGAIKVVWNWIQLQFIGRILKGVAGLVRSFSSHIAKMWSGAKTRFSDGIKVIWEWMKNSFVGRIISSIINFAKTFRLRLSVMWRMTKDLFKHRITEIRNSVANSFVGRIISNIINFAKNFRTNISKMWTSVKATFSKWITNIRNSIANSFVGRMLTSIRTLKTNFIKLAKDMWQGVKKQFGNIVDGAKALPGRIGKGIRNGRDKAINGMKSLGRGVMNAAAKPINSTVDGVNWILRKVKAPEISGKWRVPTYAKGTGLGGHKGGIAMIGEEGRELVKLPTGESFVSPNSHTLLDLPKGTQVIPNRETERILDFDIPHYAKGTKGWKSKLSDIWSFIKKPFEAVKTMMSGIKVGKSSKGMARNVAVGTLNYLKDKPVEFIKGIFKKQEETEHNPNWGAGGKPAFSWPVTSNFGNRFHPIHKVWRLHSGTDFGAPHGAPIPSTTDGTVSFAGRMGGFGNLVKVKQGIWEMYYAHLSRILTNVGRSISKGDIIGLVGSTGDSTAPHLHYETRKNGTPVNPMGLKGFKTGGVIKSKMMAMLGEEGEEVVIPTAPNRRTDAMKLLALAAKKIGADNGSFTRPSGMSGGGGNDDFKELLKEVVEQNEHLQKMVDLLMQLLDKDLEAVLAFEPVYNAIKQRMNQDKYSRHKQRRGR